MSPEEAGRDLVLRESVRHRSSLFAVTLSLVRDFGFAEEVLQEMAVVICDQWADFKPGTNFHSLWPTPRGVVVVNRSRGDDGAQEPTKSPGLNALQGEKKGDFDALILLLELP